MTDDLQIQEVTQLVKYISHTETMVCIVLYPPSELLGQQKWI